MTSENAPWQAPLNQPDQYTSQRAALGRDLLRLSALDAPTEANGAMEGQAPVSAVATGSVGGALSQLVAAVAARSMIWGEPQLTQAARAFSADSAARNVNATLYTNLTIMNTISHAIEERVIRDSVPTEVYAGFQRLSLLKPQTRRYRALCSVASHVLAYGLNDLAEDDRLFSHPRLLPLSFEPRLGTGLEAFWFVVTNHPRLTTALVARHVGGDLWSRSQGARTYTGFWTFDAAVVEQVVTILRQGARMVYQAR